MSLLRPIAVVVAAGLWWTSAGGAQTPPPPKDDVLDGLLKKLEQGQKPDRKPEQAPKDDNSKTPSAPRPGADVAPKDQALDSLLEKLGTTEETPSTAGRPPTPGPAPTPPGPSRPHQPTGPELQGKVKDLDEHLEELTGRKRKKKQNEQDGQGSGPLSDIVKQMREVEQRLGKPDTGEETRKKQEQIVKKLDDFIEQLRNSSSQGKMTRIREVRKTGQKSGNQKGGPGAQSNTGGGVSAMRPARPQPKSVLAIDKNEWGHLPQELRGEMDNVFKEESLPERADLIRRYYLSVAKKGQSRAE